jgi:hypothetical protein
MMKKNFFQPKIELLEDRTVPSTFMLTDYFGGTWSDAEKLPGDDGPGEPTGLPNRDDDWMCWAAAASNSLEWTGWGKVNNMLDSDAMFEYFQDHWTDFGASAYYAWEWWFDGTDSIPQDQGGASVDVPGAGFFPHSTFSNYYHGNTTDSTVMNSVADFLRAGYSTTLALHDGNGGGHQITCWGYEYDSTTGDPLGIYVTDSDDDKRDPTPDDQLRYYRVSRSGGRWHLQNYASSNDWYISAVQALEQLPLSLRPDLAHQAGYSNSLSSTTVAPGEFWSSEFYIKNYGATESDEFDVDFYASTNPIITSSDHHLGRVHVWSLSPNESTGVYLSVSDFPELPVGDYYVGITIDADGAVRESDESNNTVVEYLDRLSVGRADLVGTSFDSVARARWGGSFSLDARIANQGTGNAGSFTVRFYLSSNNSISSGDYLLEEQTIPFLAAGDSYLFDNHTLRLPYFPPSGFTPSDSVWIGMTIDSNGDVPESNEGNNRNQGYLVDMDRLSLELSRFSPFYLSSSYSLSGMSASMVQPSEMSAQIPDEEPSFSSGNESMQAFSDAVVSQPTESTVLVQKTEPLTGVAESGLQQSYAVLNSALDQSLRVSVLDKGIIDLVFVDLNRRSRK